MVKFSDLQLLDKLMPGDSTRDILVNLINMLPNIVGILDDDRRLIYANPAMQEAILLPNFEAALNLRPGELFSCVNSYNDFGGCGASEACELCGAFRAMRGSRAEMKSTTNEFRILSKDSNGVKAYNFRFTSTPFMVGEQFFYFLNITDIGGEKRQAELERIFFHDILNSIGGLYGVIQLIKNDQSAEPKHIKIMEAIYNTLYDTVKEQRQLMQAERKELKVKIEEIDSRDLIIENIVPFDEQLHHRSNIQMSEDTADSVFRSDNALLSRVLTNMIKNALEASGENDTITVGARKMDKGLRFWVNNPGFIERADQLQIFNRSFSTKGSGRGIGTFSIKLIGEEYLGGNVGFSSNEKEGTTFWIDLP